MEIFLIIIFIVILIFLGSFFEVCWLPTRKNDYDRIAELANIRPREIFYDLGSGGGGLLFYLAPQYDADFVGMEISPILYLLSKIRAVFYKNVTIRYGNFLKNGPALSSADIIYAFLHPESSIKIEKLILPKLKRHSRMVLSSWPLKGRLPDQISEENKQPPYFLYITKDAADNGNRS